LSWRPSCWTHCRSGAPDGFDCVGNHVGDGCGWRSFVAPLRREGPQFVCRNDARATFRRIAHLQAQGRALGIPPNPRDEREFRECARLRWHVPCRGAGSPRCPRRACRSVQARQSRTADGCPGREASELGRELGPRCSTADALRCPTRSGWKPSARSSAPGRDRPVSHAKQPSTSFEVQRRRAGPDDDLTGTGWWLLHVVELQGVTRFAVPMQSAGADGHAERMT
jgi:hypothetical protein